MENKTLEELKQANLDVYLFHPHRTDLQSMVALNARNSGREAIEFETMIGTTKLIGVAVGKRKNHGQTAKTVRKFIQQEG